MNPRPPFEFVDPMRAMPAGRGARIDHARSALAALRAEEQRLERLGLTEAARRCREQRRYWEFLAALFSLERESMPEPRTDEERPRKRAARGIRAWPIGDPPGFEDPLR